MPKTGKFPRKQRKLRENGRFRQIRFMDNFCQISQDTVVLGVNTILLTRRAQDRIPSPTSSEREREYQAREIRNWKRKNRKRCARNLYNQTLKNKYDLLKKVL